MADIISEIRTLIYKELPNKWGWVRKNDAAERILTPLRRHIEQICQERRALDETIDRLMFTESPKPLDTGVEIGYTIEDVRECVTERTGNRLEPS